MGDYDDDSETSGAAAAAEGRDRAAALGARLSSGLAALSWVAGFSLPREEPGDVGRLLLDIALRGTRWSVALRVSDAGGSRELAVWGDGAPVWSARWAGPASDSWRVGADAGVSLTEEEASARLLSLALGADGESSLDTGRGDAAPVVGVGAAEDAGEVPAGARLSVWSRGGEVGVFLGVLGDGHMAVRMPGSIHPYLTARGDLTVVGEGSGQWAPRAAVVEFRDRGVVPDALPPGVVS